MKRALLLAFTCVLATARALGQASAPTAASGPQDFAAGLTLTTRPELALQTLLLPLDVYRGTRPDLSDMSVFDAAERPVSHALRVLEQGSRREELERELAVFPLRAAKSQQPEDLTLHVERSSNGGVIDVRVKTAKALAVGTPISAYVLCDTHDAQSVDAPQPATLSALRLELAPTAESFTLPLKVEASDDLSRWRTLLESVVIGRLQHEGERVERLRIGLDGARAGCLRLSWPGHPLPAPILKAYVELTRDRREPVPPAASLQLRSSGSQGTFELDLGAVLVLRSLLPRIPQEVLVSASLALRTNVDEPPVSVFEGQLYRLSHEGSELKSPAIELASRRARYLTFRVEQGAAALSDDPVVFDLEYTPHQLLFVRHGAGPHLLAYGSYKAGPRPFRPEQLLDALAPAVRAALPLETVRAVGKRSLGGEAARVAPAPARSYRVTILWTVLVTAAATLVLLALRMLRKTR